MALLGYLTSSYQALDMFHDSCTKQYRKQNTDRSPSPYTTLATHYPHEPKNCSCTSPVSFSSRSSTGSRCLSLMCSRRKLRVTQHNTEILTSEAGAHFNFGHRTFPRLIPLFHFVQAHDTSSQYFL